MSKKAEYTLATILFTLGTIGGTTTSFYYADNVIIGIALTLFLSTLLGFLFIKLPEKTPHFNAGDESGLTPFLSRAKI